MLIKWTTLVLASFPLAFNPANARLLDRGNGLIYDSTLNVTWISDMKFPLTSGFDSNDSSRDGRLTWAAALAWADNLEFGGYSDWRLPILLENDPTCEGAFDTDLTRTSQGSSSRGGCTGGELSHLFVVSLGNKAGQSVHNQVDDSVAQIANYTLFQNISAGIYWSSTQRMDNGAVWSFDAGNGNQLNNRSSSNVHFPIAVRSGDVSAVPEPTIPTLFAGGLVIVSLLRHSKRRLKS